MGKIVLSIVVSIYNGEKHIKNLLDTLLPQLNKSTELILIDDGSNDETLNIIKEYFRNIKNDNIVVKHKKNTGVSDSRNQGIQMSKGTFITFADCDDKYSNDFIEKVFKSIGSDLLVFDFWNLKNGKKISWINIKKQGVYLLEKNSGCNGYLNGNFYNTISPSLWNKIYKKKIIDDNNISFINGKRTSEDLIFNIEYLNACKNMRVINEKLYYYLLHNDSVTHKYKEWLILELIDTADSLVAIADKYGFKNYHEKIAEYLLLSTKTVILNESLFHNYSNGIIRIKHFFNNSNYKKMRKKIKWNKLNIKLKLYYLIVELNIYYLILACYKFRNTWRK